MPTYEFYQIKSRREEEVKAGLHKVSLACVQDPDLHLFLWLDQKNQPHQAQFLFFENLLEWHRQKGLMLMETNRKQQMSPGLGWHKGARTLSSLQDPLVLEQGRKILAEAKLPPDWAALLRALFLDTGTSPQP